MLLEMMAALSRTREPEAALDIFFDTMRRMWGIKGYIGLSCGGLGSGGYRLLRHKDAEGHDLVPGLALRDDVSSARTYSGGWLGEVCGSGVPRLFRDLHVPYDPVLRDRIAAYRTAVAAPIYDGGRIDRWAILFDGDPDAFTEESLEQLVLRANLIGVVIQNLRNVALLEKAHAQIQREVERIAQIQRALLPAAVPEIDGLRIAASYETFDRAGGDIYSFHNLDNLHASGQVPADSQAPCAIFIGDVSGHGPAAAVVMAMVHAILQAYPTRPERPSDVLRHANRHLIAKQIDASFVTAFLAFYDPTTRRLSYSAAGHPPPLWRRPASNGTTEVVPLNGVLGFPLGVVDEPGYDDSHVTLAPGQTLAFFTDGITEARNSAGGFFGNRGVEAALRRCSGEASCLVSTLTNALKSFEQGGRPHDDQTLIAIEVV